MVEVVGKVVVVLAVLVVPVIISMLPNHFR